MLPKLCNFTGEALLNLSRWALTTVLDCTKFRSKTFSASLYFRPKYRKSAIANLAFPVTSVLRYVSVTSFKNVGCESTAIRNGPTRSFHSNDFSSYLESFRSGNGSFLFDANTSAKSRTDISIVMVDSGQIWYTHDAAGF